MLTSDQIEVLRELSGQVMDPVVDFLIEDIARRISEAGQLTSTAAYQVWRAQNLGVSQKRLKKEIAKRLKVSQDELERLLTQAAEVGYDFDLARFPTLEAVPFAENTALHQILDATVKLAQEDLTNVTQTMGFVAANGKCLGLSDAYKQCCDFAFQKVVTGAQDYTSAIRDAVRGLAEKGIQTIDYESGVHTSLEAAVRRNIMGGLGLMQEQISQQNHDDLGCDGWEISAHAASAPDHEPFQGRQYSNEEMKRLEDSLVRKFDTLNCGHYKSGIILGVNVPQYSEEELEEMRRRNEEGVTIDGIHYTGYEATQRQRGIERSMRKQKRRILIDETTGDKEKLQWDQIRLVRTREEYHRFSEAAGLREQWERAEAAGFTWKHGKAATAIVKERAAATASAMEFFGVNSKDDLKSVIKRGTIKTLGGFACFPDGDSLNRHIKKVAPLESFFDVAMHGSPTAVGFGTEETNMSARTLAAVIRHSKGYKGQKIRLLSCSTGRIVGEEYCFAEELANSLGVEVMAPNDILYISSKGELQIGDAGDGQFVTYKPNQRRRIK